MGSQLDIHSCIDACTHSKQGVGTKIRCLGHTCSDTQGHPTFHVTIHRGWTRHGCKVDINSCTDACTHSKQGVGPQAG